MGSYAALGRALARLHAKGVVAQCTHEPSLMGTHMVTAAAALTHGLVPSVYAGFDPTAPTIHLGHLPLIIMLRRLQNAGLRPIVLVGGATALIGDPTGKMADRPLLPEASVCANSESMGAALMDQLTRPAPPRWVGHEEADRGEGGGRGGSAGARPTPLLVNNEEFYRDMNVLRFMREVGVHARLNAMLNKESVRARMHAHSGADAGMSFTEFSYQLFQAHDFVQLHRRHGCILQLGGSDQWGNITAGLDLARRCEPHAHMHALTLSLLTTKDGKKFGKSEGNAIWVDAALTSNFAVYQYLLGSADADVGRLLRYLTLLPEEVIEDAEARHAQAPERKVAQRLLAHEVTHFLRGAAAAARAAALSRWLFAGSSAASADAESPASDECSIEVSASDVRVEDVLPLVESKAVPGATLPKSQLVGRAIVDVLVDCKMLPSKAEARRLIASRGLYMNGARIEAPQQRIEQHVLEATPVLTFKQGKRRMFLVVPT